MTDLLDLMRAPAIRRPVDPDGHVVQGPADETLALRHRRHSPLAWHRAEIELHRHDDGAWMWSASFNLGWWGSSYKVGPKWGKFAATRDDALFHAVRELEGRLARLEATDKEAAAVLRWARGLR